jgi:hypothetical protein
MYVGIVFSSEAELDVFLAGRGTVETPAAPTARVEQTAPLAVIEEPRAPGRPSFNRILDQAAKALALDPQDSLSDRARRILRHLAKTHSADELPSQRCVRDFLAEQSVRKNGGNKYGKNKRRAKLLATQGEV